MTSNITPTLRTAKEQLKSFALSISYPACVGVDKPFVCGLSSTHVRAYLIKADDATLFPKEFKVGSETISVEFVVAGYNVVSQDTN